MTTLKEYMNTYTHYYIYEVKNGNKDVNLPQVSHFHSEIRFLGVGVLFIASTGLLEVSLNSAFASWQRNTFGDSYITQQWWLNLGYNLKNAQLRKILLVLYVLQIKMLNMRNCHMPWARTKLKQQQGKEPSSFM